jgi:peptide/nickel transport system ATP-binding protein
LHIISLPIIFTSKYTALRTLSANEVILQIKDLKIDFQSDGEKTTAVNHISLDIHRGKTIGIVGESGSGKSVTSLSIMRLIQMPPGKISNGTITFHKDGKEINLYELSDTEMRKIRGNEIAMIFQEPMTSLNPVEKCGWQVQEAILLHQKCSRKEAKKRTIELFDKVKLPRPEAIFNSYPHQISGGQKQRVMIAMALSCNPSVLIADEPTTALDVTVQKTILKILKDLQNEMNMGIIFITHDLGVIAELADEVAVMYKGQLVESGPIEDVFVRPKHPYTKGLLACRPPMDILLRELPTRKDFIKEENGVLVPTDVEVLDVIKKLTITQEEIDFRRDIIYGMDPLVRVQNLKTYFAQERTVFGKVTKWVKAVDNVTFDIYPGETLGLVGESGCGKTTLGRTILKLIQPTSGSIIFNGEDITHLSERQMRKLRKDVQIIFQDPYSSLNPRISIGEAIMEPMRVHGICENDFQRKQEVIELLQKVGLREDQFNRYPHEFSGGQRQRICIARAIALKPKFVICDESVSALDVSVQADVLNLLNNLRDEFGLTYLFISHDLSVVKFMSDRIIVMNKGKIEEEGTSEMIYNHPKNDYTKTLINSIPRGIIDKVLG